MSRSVASAAVLAALVAGCGGGESAAPENDDQGSGAATTTTQPVSPPHANRGSIVRERPWRPAGSVPSDAESLTISVDAGFCTGQPRPRFHHARVEESKETVEITTHVLITPTPGLCAGVGYSVKRTIELREPLGDRELVDGSGR